MTVPRPALALLAAALLAAGCSGTNGTSGQPTAPPTDLPTATPTVSPLGPEDPLSPRPAVESPAPLGQPTCVPAALTVTDADAITGASTTQEVFLVRTTGRPCELDGWPAVTFLDAAGHPLPVTVGHGGFGVPPGGPAPVTLSRDTTVSFLVGTRRTGSCLQAATLVVTLPGTRAPLRTATALRLCGGAGTSPVQRLQDTEGVPAD